MPSTVHRWLTCAKVGLEASLRALAANATSAARRHPYRLLGTLSGGYDSTAVTALARDLGLDEALTFARSDGPTCDTGEKAAAHLGIHLTVVAREAWRAMPFAEVPFVAADSFGEEVHFSAAEAELRGRLLLTGYHGDKVWAKDTPDLTPNIVRGDLSGLSLSEYRLWAGFVHCPVPFWAVRRIRDIHAISTSREMQPWDIPGSYSRPIRATDEVHAAIMRAASVGSSGWPRLLTGYAADAIGRRDSRRHRPELTRVLERVAAGTVEGRQRKCDPAPAGVWPGEFAHWSAVLCSHFATPTGRNRRYRAQFGTMRRERREPRAARELPAYARNASLARRHV